MPVRLTESEFAELVNAAVASLPGEFDKYMENLSVDVQPLPSDEILARLNASDGRGILGIYSGVPLTKKSVRAPYDWPERVIIYQRNVEAVCDTREEIVDRVRKTVLHEVGHHFGLSEQELGDLGYQ